MNLETLKRQIVATVDTTEDEALLQDVMEILSKHPLKREGEDVSDAKLTQFCMLASEKSLSEAWENEDNEYWNSFLKN